MTIATCVVYNVNIETIIQTKGCMDVSTNDLATTARELRSLKQMREDLEVEITALEDRIKAEMELRGIDNILAGDCRIRWTSYTSSRFDTTAFKKDHAALAATYTKPTECRRFSLS